MNEKIVLPKEHGQRYYRTHYAFFQALAAGAGKEVEIRPMTEDGRGFSIIYRGLKMFIDYGDHKKISPIAADYPLHFRYHYSQERHGHFRNCYPLTPISFYNWPQYFRIEKELKYTAKGDKILNKQKPGKASLERRRRVQKLLVKTYRHKADLNIDSQLKFWWALRDCLVAVCVPGAREDILDRGQFQYWAFGACTISPRLDITLPYRMEPFPGRHYIVCKPDYSDLIEKIEYCRANRKVALRIGAEAKQLFQATATPRRIWEWIDFCLNTNLEEK